VTWRSPDTYHPAGLRRGTATSNFYDDRDNLGWYRAQLKRGRWYVVPGNWNTIRDRIRRSGYLGMLLERNDAPCFLTTKPDEGGKRLPDTAAVIEVVTDAVRHISGATRRIRMVGR
jgi:hypothetical protein